MKRTGIMWLALVVVLALFVPQIGQAREFGIIDEKKNRTYVPVRYISEQLGYRVHWNGHSRTVHVADSDRDIVLAIGSEVMTVDGETVTIDAPPYVEKDTTYVPLRAVAEALGLSLDVDNAAKRMTIHQGKKIVELALIPGNRWKALAYSDPVAHRTETFTVGSSKFTVQLVTVDLLHPKVDLGIALAQGKVGAVAGLDEMASASGARVAMNGTFFDAYTDSSYKVPYGHIVKDGEMVHRAPGDNRTVLVFDNDNQVEMMGGLDFADRFDGKEIEGALQVGPRLLTGGKVTVDPAKEGFKDPKILENAGARSAVGVTKDHYLLLLTVNGATILQLAEIMLQAGAVDAMNMDGGASSGLYVDGQLVTPTGRDISNALLVHVRED